MDFSYIIIMGECLFFNVDIIMNYGEKIVLISCESVVLIVFYDIVGGKI